MLYILTGPDDFSRSEALAEIKNDLNDDTLLFANTTSFDGRQLTLEQLENVCAAAPFLSQNRLVIIEGLLERFEPNLKPGRSKRPKRKENQGDDSQSWANLITQAPESTKTVLVDGKIGNQNPLYKRLSEAAQVRFFPQMNKPQLRQWIEKRVRMAGGRISPQAADTLTKLVGSNLWMVSHEIDKLAMFALGRPIEEADIAKVVGYAQELNVFNLVDAIFEMKPGVAERALGQLLERGANPAYIMVMLSRQIRLIARIKGLRNQGKSEMDIQNTVGLKLEFVFRKTMEQANRYSLEKVKEFYNRLLEADMAIKTGSFDGELALNILIADLCRAA